MPTRHRFFLCVVSCALIPILCAPVTLAHASPLTTLRSKLTKATSSLPRYQRLPLFNPHRKTFTCARQDQVIAAVDPQAELWFQQALALDDLNVYYKKRNWNEIYRLYMLAAERNHWKAMLNMSSLILAEDLFPEQNTEVAIQWVEKAMMLGVPDAYDHMGVFHQNGIVKGADATSAYAFFQKAADMGSPSAMAYLGDKLAANWDSGGDLFWGNMPIGTKMLECAFAQGHGDAAYDLSFLQAGDYTESQKQRALLTLHEGVKMGSAKCAGRLSVQFDGWGLDNGRNLIGQIDSARADRYSVIGQHLDFYSGRIKLPNLDKVLPLPPAPLPKWDGDVHTLINAAKAVVPEPKDPKPQSSLPVHERIPEGHGVLSLEQSTRYVLSSEPAPETGYWIGMIVPTQPFYNGPPMEAHHGRAEFYRAGESFEPALMNGGWPPQDVRWYFVGQPFALPPTEQDLMQQRVKGRQARQVSRLANLLKSNGMQSCPQTGVWQGRIDDKHALAPVYNQWFQQAFVQEGQPFPDPAERYLGIQAHEVTWTYLGSPNQQREGTDVMDIAL